MRWKHPVNWKLSWLVAADPGHPVMWTLTHSSTASLVPQHPAEPSIPYDGGASRVSSLGSWASSPPPQPDPGRPASSKPSWWSHLWYPTSRRRSRGCMPPARNAGRPCWGHGLLHLVCSGIGTSLAALLDGWPKVRCIAAAQKESSAVWEKGLHSASLPFSQQDGLGLNTYWRPTTSYLLPFELRQVFALIALAVLGHCRRWRLSREKSSWGRSSNQTLWRAIRGEGWPRQ